MSSISHVLIAERCPAEQRTTAFSAIGAANLLSQIIFVPTGGALTTINSWVPMLLSSVFMVVGFFAAVFLIPETPPPASKSGISPVDARPQSPAVSRNSQETCTQNDNTDAVTSMRGRILKHIGPSLQFMRWLIENGRVGLVLFCFFAFTFGEQAMLGPLLLQYAAKRLGWGLGRASFLLSLGAGIHLLDLMLLIPALSNFFLVQLRFSEQSKDKRLVQLSGTALTIGAVATCFATSWLSLILTQVMTGLGYAFSVPTRSLITGMVKQEHLGVLYTAISVFIYAGLLTGSPLFAVTLRVGMQWGSLWFGLPFLVAGLSFLLATLAITIGVPLRGSRADVSQE